MLRDEIAAYLTSEDVDVFRDRSYAGADGILALPAMQQLADLASENERLQDEVERAIGAMRKALDALWLTRATGFHFTPWSPQAQCQFNAGFAALRDYLAGEKDAD
jgi:hypothetical protein